MLTAVKYLKIFVEFEEYIQALDDGEKGRLFAAMLAYARDGQEPELPGNERFLWPVARQQLKNAAAQYQKVCAANSANARRRGGVPPQSRPTRPLRGLDQSEESQQVPGDLAGVPPVSRPTRQAQGPSAESGVPPVSRPTRPLQGLGQSEESQQVPGDLASEEEGEVPHVPPCPPGELGGEGSFSVQGPQAGVPPVSRPTRPLQGLDQSEESQQVPGDLASEAAEAVALEDRSGRLGGLEPLGGRAICALPLGDGVDYPIFDWKAAEWARQFPSADVPVQLAKMRAWLLAHPERRKRKQEIIPFVLRWLEKAQKAQRPPVCPAAPAASMAGAEPPSFNLEAIRQLMLENSGAY